MRLDLPHLRERFGAVLFYGLQSVYELDSGFHDDKTNTNHYNTNQLISYQNLYEQLSDMVIVVPVREEKLKLLEGVLAGIPHSCQIIIVSASSRTPIDRFQLESDLIETVCAYTNRNIIIVHQRDPRLAKAFADSGYTSILDDEGLIRQGKAEGMMLGIMLAKLTGRSKIGFVDSDNYFPGSVLEYCYLYGAGFAMAKGKGYDMVRISWHSKPKIVESNLYFAKWGRSSVVTNNFLNQLVSHYTGFETEVIRTGNAGEHAMTMDLAMEMEYSSGYSIEPYQLVYLMEEFGGILVPHVQHKQSQLVNVYQLESRNPHLHEHKGEEHVEKMIEASLSVIFHSKLCPESLQESIRKDLADRKILSAKKEIPTLRRYESLNKANIATFQASLDWMSSQLEEVKLP